ncbi:polyphosphate:AMP phosphotransferase [Lyngbya confervoides]|uniref:Polyphosphate:AMP phosphotransferase n=1 Tax=Lyngbya confervoides BDU141951 TaxID=1574623 RepID=A0ABD4SZT6_9CYAN|nr:polyphosphate:AMP phosphotransferase [Lyngbya confervoides]MCM1981829.1 polyphosphate:AMP phosphotransferase [Lyngbya confervoides BDU141951]
MFESAELEHILSDEEYQQAVPKLREALLAAQYHLLDHQDRSLLIIVGGVEGAGKGDSINVLSHWLDARHLEVHALPLQPSDEECMRPEYYRYFRRLPPKGKIGIHFGSWHSQLILDYAFHRISRNRMDAALARVCEFEQMLVEEGWTLLKLWFHLSKKKQRVRLKTLSQSKQQRWRVSERDWKLLKHYDRLAQVSSRALRETSTGYAPWHIIPGADPNYRQITLGRIVLSALNHHPQSASIAPPVTLLDPIDGYPLLRQVDLNHQVKSSEYRQTLEKYQGQLNLALRNPSFQDQALALVFEGWDAAGKGGAIRRITAALDVRFYRVISVAAPTETELRYPYLWRFWQQVPPVGHVAIFDRSWYGRVLVERVENLCSEADWMRAYKEINEFEEQWRERGVVILKFWLHISPEEQLRRFKQREETGYKRYKITPEDWRNRDKWPQYEHAVSDMIDRTSTEIAPWTIIAAEDKKYARLKVLKTILDRLNV